MSARPLFADEPVEVMRDRAIEAIDVLVRRLPHRQLSTPAMAQHLADRVLPRPPRLGSHVRYRLFETEIEDRLDKGKRRWAPAVELDVPYRGAREFFGLRAGAQPVHAPSAVVRPRSLLMTAADPDSSATDLVDRLDRQLEVIRRELEEQRRHCGSMRELLETKARQALEARRIRILTLTETAGLLNARGWLALAR